MKLPTLRFIDAVPIEHQGDTYIVLRDPEGYVENELMLSAPAFFIAAHLNGDNGVAEVQAQFARQYGIAVGPEDIENVVGQLDRAGYLLTQPFFKIKQAVEEAYSGVAIRPAYLAGKSYPDDPEELRAFIDEFFQREGGPGEAIGARPGKGPCLSCLVVPHIDFARGGHAYAHGYLHMHRRGKPHTVFVFGVAHCGVPDPFVLTRKSFDTPFGPIATNGDMVRTLADACAWDPFAYEIVHRTEHSIEFQAVMLGYLYGPNVTMVPVLCSGFSTEEEVTDPASVEGVERFLSACRELVAADPDGVAVIAAADLSHVGARFGDMFDVDDRVIREVAERDREDLAHVTAADPLAFYRSVMQDGNARRVCGLNCIYAALRSVDGVVSRGDLLHYDYAHDPAGGIVSFAAGSFAR